MPSYKLTAKVDQIVTKTVQLTVTASCEEDAQAKAREALNEYPKPVAVAGVYRIVTVGSNYWIPKSIDFVSTEQQKESA